MGGGEQTNFSPRIIAPLNGKADGVWGRRFDISRRSKTARHRRRDAHAGFQVAARANLQRAFRDLRRARKFITAWPSSSTTKPRS